MCRSATTRSAKSADLASEFRAGDTVTFRASKNYDRWIDRAELRITTLERGTGKDQTLVLPMAADGTVDWKMPDGDKADFAYVLRVYDGAGRFDETMPARISRRTTPVTPDLNGPVTAAGEGDDRTARRNIPLAGGMVTVSGESLPQRDELRGIGGSVYVMKRRDLVSGSETLRGEIVDPVTGRVVSTRTLAVADDYRIDYFQGTVILTEPLTASASSGGPVTGGPASDYAVNLVAQYEYVPTITDPDGTAFGRRRALKELSRPGARTRKPASRSCPRTSRPTSDRTTWAFLASYSNQVSEDWRFLADIDALVSDSDQEAFLDGRYVEASLGYAWRPRTTTAGRAGALYLPL